MLCIKLYFPCLVPNFLNKLLYAQGGLRILNLKFSDLQLHPSLQKSIDDLKYSECTPIQEQSIPLILAGKDLAGLAQTGTGKTAAFLVPLIERIIRSREALKTPTNTENQSEIHNRIFPNWHAKCFNLILVPTRELAEQVFENVMSLKTDLNLKAIAIYGGVGYDKQKEALQSGVDFIVATPGRLIDLYKEHLIDMKAVRAVVFDEADRMFDMGFKDDMKFILSRIPNDRQFLVFSATLNLDVLNTAYQFGANPVEVNISRDQATAENVEDKIFHVGQDEKPAYLLSLIKKHEPKQLIVFSNFKVNVPRITQFLNDNSLPAVGISSMLSQSQRNKVIEQFKSENERNILVATDVAARGLDIKGVDMVINFELPDDPENYVHRIGRTGRAGAKGTAFSFVSDRDVEALGRVETYLKHKVDTDWLEDSEILKEFKPILSSDHFKKEPFARHSSAHGAGSNSRPQRKHSSGRPQNRDGQRPHQDKQRTQHKSNQPNSKSSNRNNSRQDSRYDSRQDSKNDSKQNSFQNKKSNSNGSSRHDSNRKQFQRNQPNSRRHNTRQGQVPAVVQKSIGQKISNFFKRLFK